MALLSTIFVVATGHALGAIGASGFGAGLLAGAAYQHHKKHYHRHELLHKKDNAERKEEKKSETKYHLHSYDVGLPPYAFVSLLRDDPHHVLGSSLKHGVVITHRGSQW
ncbi:hypothetical protein BIW11_07641 [Tropilaelaps mercedesae]|uniref:Uncharacterized protein n=1 Tax=Tropilaelaps mercedesae TaxID=418985 RepID=A0A1V9XT50_9ACAR|nr:hypothetical protein BIW11_07641 [Tropilaelaps mercedesae]